MATNGNNLIVLLSSEEMSGMAQKVAEELSLMDERYSHLDAEYKQFANGEIVAKIPETIRSKEVYFFHSLYHPDPNTSLVKMLLTNNAVALASVKSLVLVVPFMSYLRQDRKDQPRVSISARAIADIIEANRMVKRIITMDMHVEQEEGFFSIPVDNLRGRTLHAEYFKKTYGDKLSNFMVVAPDFGAAVRARRFAKMLGEDIPVGILEKERRSGAESITHSFIGEDPSGKDVILYDDMIDSGGTIILGIRALKERKVKQVHVCVTHGIFSATSDSTAEEKFSKEGVPVIITNTIPRSAEYCKKNSSWLTVLPIEELLVKVINQSEIQGGSVSTLF
jgi:ribose-phosphate pyrophosphokinase